MSAGRSTKTTPMLTTPGSILKSSTIDLRAVFDNCFCGIPRRDLDQNSEQPH